MNRTVLAGAAALLLVAFAAVVACGGDSDGDNNNKNGDSSPVASGSATRASSAQTGSNTPGSGATSDPAGAPTSINRGSLLTPDPGTTFTPSEATIAAQLTGNAQDPPSTVGTPVPTRSGASIDSDEITDPLPPDSGLHIVVDMNVNESGIQSEREARVGDVIRIGLVYANLPQDGMASTQMNIDYDKRVIVAQTLQGGSQFDRNPNVNEAALQGGAWDCLPPAEGDLDDGLGIIGDGVPETGEAFYSCFGIASAIYGTVTFATIEFHVIGEGTTTIQPRLLVIGDSLGVVIAECPGDITDYPEIPCKGGTLRVN